MFAYDQQFSKSYTKLLRVAVLLNCSKTVESHGGYPPMKRVVIDHKLFLEVSLAFTSIRFSKERVTSIKNRVNRPFHGFMLPSKTWFCYKPLTTKLNWALLKYHHGGCDVITPVMLCFEISNKFTDTN